MFQSTKSNVVEMVIKWQSAVLKVTEEFNSVAELRVSAEKFYFGWVEYSCFVCEMDCWRFTEGIFYFETSDNSKQPSYNLTKKKKTLKIISNTK